MIVCALLDDIRCNGRLHGSSTVMAPSLMAQRFICESILLQEDILDEAHKPNDTNGAQ
jgi:hypothetical protein